MANKDQPNVAVMMAKVFGDNLNGLSEAEVAYVRDAMLANLEKIKGEAKERAAWNDVLTDIAEVLTQHGKMEVVKGKVLRVTFGDDGAISAFKIQKARTSTGSSTSNGKKQCRKPGQAWEDCPNGTWAGACAKHNLQTNGASGQSVLKSAGFETRVVEAS